MKFDTLDWCVIIASVVVLAMLPFIYRWRRSSYMDYTPAGESEDKITEWLKRLK